MTTKVSTLYNLQIEVITEHGKENNPRIILREPGQTIIDTSLSEASTDFLWIVLRCVRAEFDSSKEMMNLLEERLNVEQTDAD